MTNDTAAVLAASKEWHVEQADCTDYLCQLPGQSVDLVMCSPPYEKARKYLEDGVDLGVARGTEEWVAWLVEVSKQALRVCKGLVVLVVEGQTKNYRYSCGPALLMADLCRAGVTLRKPAVYQRYGIPGSGGPDWLRNDYEFCVCMTNGGKLPWSDPTACGKPCLYPPGGDFSNRHADGGRNGKPKRGARGRMTPRRDDGIEVQHYTPPEIANPGNVINCGAVGVNIGSKLASYNEAPYPERLAEFFIRSFCPLDGIVLDPFSGSGTTGAVAVRWRRRFIGCDLRASQVKLSKRRIETETPMMEFMAQETDE